MSAQQRRPAGTGPSGRARGQRSRPPVIPAPVEGPPPGREAAAPPAAPPAHRLGPIGRVLRRAARRIGGPDGPRDADHSLLSYYALLLATVLLLTLGLMTVFSVQQVVSAARERDAVVDFSKYLIFAGVGLIGMWGMSLLSERALRYLAIPVLVGATALQSLVFTPLGTCTGGNCNWVEVPGIGTAQPSEFIKVGLSLYTGLIAARWFAEGRWQRLHWLVKTAAALLPAAAIALVMGGGDLGTVIILGVLLAGAGWMAGLAKRWFVTIGAAGAALFVFASVISLNRRTRILVWLHPDRDDPLDIGYQPKHARWAMATGGWRGVGPGSSRQKWGYLTQAESDYAYAVLGEELGLVGALLVIVLFAVLGWALARIIRRSNSLYASVVVGGIMVWIIGQAIINMAVVTNLLPVLGVPLPLISQGGSALISVLLAIGIALSFARREPGAQQALRSRPGAVRRTLAVISTRRRNRA
ncbi:FtsW/RodA/SpoVE family cell cycle protein [Actinomyces sp. zg328]|uniref:FtsW/RodA/SpoVE family cell cycle protein n=1 Tax=Actinomyces sp. zg328 TaxID=2609287 RepID=UPI001358F3D8|nr:putative peptidoglycan glycosyltransferase FtsW [Actinomyces sp. zg328]